MIKWHFYQHQLKTSNRIPYNNSEIENIALSTGDAVGLLKNLMKSSGVCKSLLYDCQIHAGVLMLHSTKTKDVVKEQCEEKTIKKSSGAQKVCFFYLFV